MAMAKTVKEVQLSSGDKVWFVTTWPSGDTEVICQADKPDDG
jgi:hypothetical protein